MATTTTFVKSRRVREMTVTLTFADTTSAEMFKFPDDTRIVDWIINVTTAFSGGTTELDIGTSADPDYYVDGASLATLGRAAIGDTLKKGGAETTAVTPVYMNVGAGNTVGEAEVTCLFSNERAKRF